MAKDENMANKTEISEAEAAKPADNAEVADNGSDIEDISEEIKKKPKKKKKSVEQDTSVQQFRNKRGWVKWVVIALVVVGVIVFFVFRAKDAAKKMAESMNQVQTDEIKRMDLSKAISTTGTIQSKDVRTITSKLSGVKIEQVNCKVGDMVNQGDIMVTFSREDINKKIGQLEEDILEAKQVKGLDGGDRVNTYNNSNGLDFYNVASAYDKVKKAEIDLQKAKDALQRVCDQKAEFRALHDEAKEKVESVEIDLENKRADYAAATTPEEKGKIQTDIDDLTAKLTNYRSALGTNYEDKITSFEEQEKAKFDARDQAQRDYDAAIVAYNKSNYDAYYSGEKSEYNLNKGNVQANDNVKNLQRQKEQNEDSLDDYIVTAPISGLVTAVNAQEGNGYQATTGALLTIQAVDILEVTTQVDEYDINNVKVGQSVAIMTDATGDDELEGVVTFIAPTSTSAQSGSTGTASAAASSSSSTTFEVKIDIQKKDERLRLGMSAKLNILIDTHKNVLAVPYDAIEEEEGGAKYIYVMGDNTPGKDAEAAGSGDGGIQVIGVDGTATTTPAPSGAPGGGPGDDVSFNPVIPSNAKKIPVQIGLEGDYYTEVISPDIKEGMTVVVNSTAGEIKNDMDMFMGM